MATATELRAWTAEQWETLGREQLPQWRQPENARALEREVALEARMSALEQDMREAAMRAGRLRYAYQTPAESLATEHVLKAKQAWLQGLQRYPAHELAAKMRGDGPAGRLRQGTETMLMAAARVRDPLRITAWRKASAVARARNDALALASLSTLAVQGLRDHDEIMATHAALLQADRGSLFNPITEDMVELSSSDAPLDLGADTGAPASSSGSLTCLYPSQAFGVEDEPAVVPPGAGRGGGGGEGPVLPPGVPPVPAPVPVAPRPAPPPSLLVPSGLAAPSRAGYPVAAMPYAPASAALRRRQHEEVLRILDQREADEEAVKVLVEMRREAVEAAGHRPHHVLVHPPLPDPLERGREVAALLSLAETLEPRAERPSPLAKHLASLVAKTAYVDTARPPPTWEIRAPPGVPVDERHVDRGVHFYPFWHLLQLACSSRSSEAAAHATVEYILQLLRLLQRATTSSETEQQGARTEILNGLRPSQQRLFEAHVWPAVSPDKPVTLGNMMLQHIQYVLHVRSDAATLVLDTRRTAERLLLIYARPDGDMGNVPAITRDVLVDLILSDEASPLTWDVFARLEPSGGAVPAPFVWRGDMPALASTQFASGAVERVLGPLVDMALPTHRTLGAMATKNFVAALGYGPLLACFPGFTSALLYLPPVLDPATQVGVALARYVAPTASLALYAGLSIFFPAMPAALAAAMTTLMPFLVHAGVMRLIGWGVNWGFPERASPSAPAAAAIERRLITEVGAGDMTEACVLAASKDHHVCTLKQGPFRIATGEAQITAPGGWFGLGGALENTLEHRRAADMFLIWGQEYPTMLQDPENLVTWAEAIRRDYTTHYGAEATPPSLADMIKTLGQDPAANTPGSVINQLHETTRGIPAVLVPRLQRHSPLLDPGVTVPAPPAGTTVPLNMGFFGTYPEAPKSATELEHAADTLVHATISAVPAAEMTAFELGQAAWGIPNATVVTAPPPPPPVSEGVPTGTGPSLPLPLPP